MKLRFLALSLVMTACSANRFSGAVPSVTVSGAASEGASGAVRQPGGVGEDVLATLGQGATVGSGSLTLVQPAVGPCEIKATGVLVLDLKSGWWAGDGAQTFKNLAKYVSNRCTTVTMEYGHITVLEEATKSFPSKPFADYDEIWLLSGNELDDADIRTSGATFQRLLAGIKNSGANVLIGAGSGAVYHANAVSTALGLGTAFVKGEQTGTGLVPLGGFGDTVAIASAITSGLSGPLFKNVNALPDSVRINGLTFVTDKLVPSPEITMVAANAAGVAEIGTASVGTRKIVFDADLARLYPILTTEQNTRNYLVNLLTYLQK